MSKKLISTLLLIPLFSLFIFVGGSYAWSGKDKTPKPEKPAPKAAYEIAKVNKGSKTPKPEQPKPESPKAVI
jgi:flagellar basal body-associated protein FliL